MWKARRRAGGKGRADDAAGATERPAAAATACGSGRGGRGHRATRAAGRWGWPSAARPARAPTGRSWQQTLECGRDRQRAPPAPRHAANRGPLRSGSLVAGALGPQRQRRPHVAVGAALERSGWARAWRGEETVRGREEESSQWLVRLTLLSGTSRAWDFEEDLPKDVFTRSHSSSVWY